MNSMTIYYKNSYHCRICDACLPFGVDDVHRHNFSSRANRILLEKFNKKYPPPIKDDLDPFSYFLALLRLRS